MLIYLDTTDKRLSYANEFLTNKNIKTQIISNNDFSKCETNSIIVTSPAYKWTKENLTKLPESTTLVAGSINSEYQDVLEKKQIIHINLMKDSNFVKSNAKLTAEGVLANLISNTDSSIFENKILVVGGGNVASAIGELFCKLKLNFDYITKNLREFKELNKKTHNCLNWENINAILKNYDVIINTVPAQIFSKQFSTFKQNSVILEIASNPCLNENDFENITYVKCPALPTKFTPKSAGKLISKKITNILKGEK